MKRIHEEVQQEGELVFTDATSNTEEHIMKVFAMCTHSVTVALPLGVLTTTDERESTLKQGFDKLHISGIRPFCLYQYQFDLLYQLFSLSKVYIGETGRKLGDQFILKS